MFEAKPPESERLTLIVLAAVAFSSCASSGDSPEEVVKLARQRVVEAPRITQIPGLSVTVPLVGHPTLPLVEASLNGKGPYHLLVDTGANVVLLQSRVARELALPILRPGAESQLVAVDNLRIGEATFRDLVAGARTWSEAIDGVLGMSVFQRLLLTIDYPGKRVTIANGSLSPADAKTRLALWINENRHPMIPATLGGARWDFMIDTGASQWLTLPEKMAGSLTFQAPPRAGPRLTSHSGDESLSKVAKLAGSLQIGLFELREPMIVLTEEDVPLLGSGFFQNFIVTIDYAGKVLELVSTRDAPLVMPQESLSND